MLTDWKFVDAGLRRLARLRAGHDHEEGLFLLAARRTAVHRHLGSLSEYVARVLGYDARTTNERLRVAEALQGLPLLSAALRDGAVTWSAVRELTRVAAPGTEAAWLSTAAGRTAQEVQSLVSGLRPGARRATPRIRACSAGASGSSSRRRRWPCSATRWAGSGGRSMRVSETRRR